MPYFNTYFENNIVIVAILSLYLYLSLTLSLSRTYTKPNQTKSQAHKMGNCTSYEQNGAVKFLNGPSPQAFAIMSNGHECIRGNIALIQEHLDVGESKLDDAMEMYHRLKKWSEVYNIMMDGTDANANTSTGTNTDQAETAAQVAESDNDSNDDNGNDGNNGDKKTSPKGFLSILDKHCDGIITNEGLYETPQDLKDAKKQMEEAINTQDIDKIRVAFHTFRTTTEAHLNKKENVIMPKVLDMKKSKVNMKTLMVEEVLALAIDLPDFQFFVQHANFILDKYDEDLVSKTRAFDHALWVCATPEQWKLWRVWIKGSVPEERYNEIMNAISF